MRKIFSILFILISLSFISCSKAPFSEKEPQSTIANVYVYALLDEEASSADNQASFKVYVNKNSTMCCLIKFIPSNNYFVILE